MYVHVRAPSVGARVDRYASRRPTSARARAKMSSHIYVHVRRRARANVYLNIWEPQHLLRWTSWVGELDAPEGAPISSWRVYTYILHAGRERDRERETDREIERERERKREKQRERERAAASASKLHGIRRALTGQATHIVKVFERRAASVNRPAAGSMSLALAYVRASCCVCAQQVSRPQACKCW